MKRKTRRRVTAFFMAVLMVVGIMPMDFAVNKVSARTVTSNIDVSQGLKAGTVYGDESIVKVEVLEDMNLKDESADTVDGVAYPGYVQGTNNPKPNKGDIPTSGAAFKITAVVDSTITFVTKDAAKTYHFIESTKTEPEITGTEVPKGSMKFGMKAGNTYYFYLDGSKVCVYSIVLEAGTPDLDWETVSAPVLGTPTSDAGKIIVPYNAVIGDNGGEQLKVEMYKDGVLADDSVTKAVGTSGTVEFTPASSGNYTFKAVLSREGQTDKTSNEVSYEGFVLPLAAPENLFATNKGSGSILVEWDAVTEADAYKVSYSEDGVTWSSEISVTDTQQLINGLKVGTEYTFKVVAVRENPAGESEEATIKATAAQEAQQKWGFITYGQGADSSKDSCTGSAADGSVTIKSASGKIVPASYDGLSFYYTEIPASLNFTLRAKVTVDSWKLSNGQEGFGLMAADQLGGSGWNNSYMAIASKVEYYWNTDTNEVTTDTSAKKVTHKIGIGAQEKTGVTKDNIDAIESNDTATINANFKSTMSPLEMRYPDAKNVIGNAATEVEGTIDNPITEMYLTIQKNNTGYFITYESVDGSYSTTKKYYDTEALEKIDEDTVYAGFFAARNATVTFSDISLTTIAPEDDAPAEERPVEVIAVNTNVQSATATGSADYEFLFSANCDGTLSIADAAGNYIASDVEVKADTLVKPANVVLNKGKNEFKVYFTPKEGYTPGDYQVMETYDTIEIAHTVTYKTYGEAGQSIWVAPGATGSGSKEDPMSIYDAVKYVQPTQQIVLKEGTYLLDSTLKIARGINGTEENMIYMIADPDAATRPVLDFQGLCAGMVIGGDYWYFKGFDVTNSADGQKGVQVSGSHNTLDMINTYHNGNTGIQISRLNTTDTYAEWPSYNLILNCTSYGNADAGYEDADGFAAKLTVADGNVFDGCIAHHNADDGWDLFAKVQSGAIGVVTIKNCIAYANGYLEDGTNAGNGNGFKMGGDSMPGQHVLDNCIAFANKAKGIDSNSGPDIKIKNSISINNGSYNVALYTNTAKNTDYQADGIISFRTEGLDISENIKPVGTQDTTKIYKTTNYFWDVASGTSVNSENAAVSADWFKSLDYSGILNGVVSASEIARNEDGTINLGDLFALTDKAPSGIGADFSHSKLTASANPIVGESVPTGDSAHVVIFFTLMLMSGAALAGVYLFDRKKRRLVK